MAYVQWYLYNKGLWKCTILRNFKHVTAQFGASHRERNLWKCLQECKSVQVFSMKLCANICTSLYKPLQKLVHVKYNFNYLYSKWILCYVILQPLCQIYFFEVAFMDLMETYTNILCIFEIVKKSARLNEAF